MLGGVLPTRRVRPDPTPRLRPRGRGVGISQPSPTTGSSSSDRGTKLDDDAETAIEELLDEKAGDRVGGVRTLEGALDDYVREFRTAFSLDLSGTRVALDCANGATYRAAPAIFSALGAELELIAVEPDGRNINENCGSTHPMA